MFSQSSPELAAALAKTMQEQEEARLAKEKRLRDARQLAQQQPFKRYRLTSKRLSSELNPPAGEEAQKAAQAKKKLAPEQEGPGFKLLADLQGSAHDVIEPIQPTHSNSKSPSLKFFVFGCHGDGKKNQAAVAALMEKIAQDLSQRPDFILILGDNFYDSGVKHAEDNAFKTHFDDVYKKFKEMGIPTFSILGNHDEDIHSKHIPGTAQGVAVGMHQVDHSYLKGNPYQEDTLCLDDLPLWNMPSRAYSIYHEDMEIICIDSNTYAKDYLAYVKGEDTSDTNQAVWVQKTFEEAKNAGRKVQLALHHPFETEGKRRFKAEAKMYLNETERNEFRKHIADLPHKSPHNDYVKAAFCHQGLVFDAIYAAHDHHQSYTKKIGAAAVTQITAGGGGGDLQPRIAFRNQRDMGVFLKEFGFVSVKTDKNDKSALNFQFHTVNKPEVTHEFTNQSLAPHREYDPSLPPEEITELKRIEELIRITVDEYLKFLGAQQDFTGGKFITLNLFKGNFSHGKEGIDRAHALWAYITQKKADNYLTTLKTIHELTAWSGAVTAPRPHSLTRLLAAKLQDKFRKSLHELIMDAGFEKGKIRMSMSVDCSA